MVILGSSIGIQYWGFGVLRWVKLDGKLSRVDCDWVWQQLHELWLAKLFGGVGRFGRELRLEADFFCALRVLSVPGLIAEKSFDKVRPSIIIQLNFNTLLERGGSVCGPYFFVKPA